MTPCGSVTIVNCGCLSLCGLYQTKLHSWCRARGDTRTLPANVHCAVDTSERSCCLADVLL